MREIKFRIWNRDNKMMTNMFDLDAKSMRYILKYPSDTPHLSTMQYTGLKDKNGVEIYEGDYIKAFSHVYRISFNDKVATFQMQNIDKDMSTDNGFIMDANCEVIGNIYENPELLSQKVD